jgi:hypothetical protein
VSLLISPAGVVDFIAIQRADGAGIVLNVADIGAYAGVAMLMRTTAIVIAAIRKTRTETRSDRSLDRGVVLTRLADLEVVRVVARDADAEQSAPTDAIGDAPRPLADRQVNLRVIHADGGPSRPGRTLAARLRDRDGTSRGPTASAYLRPMSHQTEIRPGR